MSYDIYIGDREFNYTYNLSALFHRHIDDCGQTGLQSLSGKTGKQAAAILDLAFQNIREEYYQVIPERTGTCLDGDRVMSNRYSPENGWGSYTSAILFLGELLGACSANSRKKVRVM